MWSLDSRAVFLVHVSPIHGFLAHFASLSCFPRVPHMLPLNWPRAELSMGSGSWCHRNLKYLMVVISQLPAFSVAGRVSLTRGKADTLGMKGWTYKREKEGSDAMCTKVLPAPFLLKTTYNCYILSNFLKQQCWGGIWQYLQGLKGKLEWDCGLCQSNHGLSKPAKNPERHGIMVDLGWISTLEGKPFCPSKFLIWFCS